MERCSIHRSCCLRPSRWPLWKRKDTRTSQGPVLLVQYEGWCHSVVLHLHQLCCKSRPKKPPQAAMGTVWVGAPFERIAVDLTGPPNETKRRNRYKVVVSKSKSKSKCVYCCMYQIASAQQNSYDLASIIHLRSRRHTYNIKLYNTMTIKHIKCNINIQQLKKKHIYLCSTVEGLAAV